MIDSAPYIKLIDALNEVETLVKTAAREGDKRFSRTGLYFGNDRPCSLDMHGHYSIQYDSVADRWTLISETDDAPNLCSFNQTEEECSKTDLCTQCWNVQEENADRADMMNDHRGL